MSVNDLNIKLLALNAKVSEDDLREFMDSYARGKAFRLMKKYKQEVVGMRKSIDTSTQLQIKINERSDFIEALRLEFGIGEGWI